MQALHDDEPVDVLEEKIERGFAEMRSDLKTEIQSAERALHEEIASASSEARADYRTLVALVFGLWATTVLGFVGVLVNLS